MDNGFDWDGGELWCWDKGLCSVALFALPSPTPPHYPPAHPSILFQPFGQLSLNPANHKLVWSVGNQARLWPQHILTEGNHFPRSSQTPASSNACSNPRSRHSASACSSLADPPEMWVPSHGAALGSPAVSHPFAGASTRPHAPTGASSPPSCRRGRGQWMERSEAELRVVG